MIKDCAMNEIITENETVMDNVLFQNIETFNLAGDITAIDPPAFPSMYELKLNEMSFFKVEQLLYDSEYPRREAFENVLRSLDNDSAVIISLIIRLTCINRI